MLLSAHQVPWVKKKKKKLENAMNYSVTFCNVNFASTFVDIKYFGWAVKYKDVLEFFV